MNGENDFYLPNGSKVFLESEKNNFEKLITLAKSEDTLNETEIMKKIGNFPPFSLLVYDEFLGWGNYHSKNEEIFLTITDYSDQLFADWIDCSFSFNKSAVRVIKKMRDGEEFSRRLKIRTRFSWVDYDSSIQTMRENMEKGCSIQKEFDSDYSNPPQEGNLFFI